MFPISDARGRIIAFGARALEADAKPKYINTGETTLFSKGHLLYNFATARAAAIKAQTHHRRRRLYGCDRAGARRLRSCRRAARHRAHRGPVAAAVAHRAGTDPVPSMATKRGCAPRIARRGWRCRMLKPGYSLRFAFLPSGEDPDTLPRRARPGGDEASCSTRPQPLSKVLWRAETEGKDFSTPERRAGLERALAEIVSPHRATPRSPITTAATSTSRSSTPSSAAQPRRSNRSRDRRRTGAFRGRRKRRPAPSAAAVRNRLARGEGSAAARRPGRPRPAASRRWNLRPSCSRTPKSPIRHGEILAELPFSDRSLDRLRHELLNLAASGFRLENPGLGDPSGP